MLKFKKRPMSSKVTLSIPKMTVIPTDEDMSLTEVYCKFFGCGDRLSLIETLCGDFCEKHFDYKKPVYFNGLL